MTRKFQRRTENFTCGHCGKAVEGDGYTNHCPHCLWSRHVDINPGDRDNSCQALMEPIGVEPSRKGYTILHRCTKCGEERRCRSIEADDFNVLLKISSSRDLPG